MSVIFNLHPELTDELREKVGFVSKNYEFRYSNLGTASTLNASSEQHRNYSTILHLNDENCIWSPESHDLIVNKYIKISKPGFLFDSSGVAHTGSEIGLALLWTSRTSNQRGSLPIGKITNDDDSYEFKFRHTFEPGSLKGKINLQVVIYLKTNGDKANSRFATVPGTVLGVLDETMVILEGRASVFPIVESYELDQPLWYVKTDWVDLTTESFDEDNVCVFLNKAHPDYNLLNVDTGLKESALLKEVIAGALNLIVIKAQQDESWDEIINGRNLESGSIGSAIHYFINTFEWDTSSPERLAFSIRKDLLTRI